MEGTGAVDRIEISGEEGLKMEKKGILVVSFGTSHLDTMAKTIQVMEEQIAEAFPGYTVYRAFTSQMILNKLERTEHKKYDNVRQALERMKQDGITRVIVQPTHIINGIENEKMLEEIQKHASSFEKVLVGKPLLSEPDDYKKTVHAVMEDVDLEGFPELKDVMHRIEQKQYRKVALLPFMFVAGDHAKNDMAGDEDSWKCELEEAGYEVRPILRGLGELPGIRQIFMEHLEEAQ